MPQIGFRADGNNNLYVYIEGADGGSSALGMTAGDNNRLHLTPSPTPDVSPSTGSPMLVLDPRLGGTLGEGDIVLAPKGMAGSGSVVVQSGTISQPGATAGVLQVDNSAQGYYRSTKGNNGEILIGSTAGVPSWAGITAGTGITVTPGANSITIAANGSAVIETITGNSGGAISPTAGNINLVTTNANVKFVGSGSTETLNFVGDAGQNLVLGSPISSLAGGTDNTGFGRIALQGLTSGIQNSAFGSAALFQVGAVNFNSGFGLSTLQNLTSGSGENTALGTGAGASLTSGSRNTFVGFEAGNLYTTSESSNVVIGTGGSGLEVPGQSHTLIIGAGTGSGNYQLNKAYISGIDGVNVGSVAKVLTMASDQLGTASITAGTGISVVASANAITIASTATSLVTSIIGDTGTAQTGALTLTGGGSGALFDSTASALTMSFNNVNLPVTTSSVGQVTIGGTAAFHAYGSQNIFGGLGTGNFTTTGAENTGYGNSVMNSLTNGAHNTGIGAGALVNVTSGISNTAIGQGSGSGLITGNNNTLLGATAGSSYVGAESNNIVIGSGVLGTAAESNTIRIGDSGFSKCFVGGIDGINVGSVATVLTMNGAGTNQLGTAVITAGTNISVVASANAVTINATGAASFSWTDVSGTSQAATVNSGYTANNAGLVTITLPVTAAYGTTIRVVGKGAGGWKVAQNASQLIHFNSGVTTTGATGFLASAAQYDCAELLCTVADTTWTVISSEGNITVS